MANLLFYGGINSIGGNCIIIEDDGKKLMLDNGMNFSDNKQFYKDFLKPRGPNGIRDYLELGLAPAIPGIYGNDMLNDVGAGKIDANGQYMVSSNLESYEAYKERNNGVPAIEAFLLSHAHLDHVKYLQFMAPEIPVIVSAPTHEILKTLADVSNDDFLHYSGYELTAMKGGYFPGTDKKGKIDRERSLRILEPYIEEKIGNCLVTAYPVDHSLPGATAFRIITSDEKKVVYTGDIRFHGQDLDKQNSNKFVDEISANNTDALICEGTNVNEISAKSEDSVFQEMIYNIENDPGSGQKSVFASFPWKNISRLFTVYRVANHLERILVIQPKLAYLMQKFDANPALGTSDFLANDNVKIYLPRKEGMCYFDSDYTLSKHMISGDVNWADLDDISTKFYNKVYGPDKLIKAFEIRENPAKYIVHLEFYDLNEFVDIQPVPGTLYFNLRTEPFDEEGKIEKKVLQNWLDRYDIQIVDVHASGHAYQEDLFNMIQKIEPKMLFPIHTEHPEVFYNQFSGTCQVFKDIDLGTPYTV